jgi:sulfite reductase (NADPH) flavoprotein alpha-component
MLPEHAPFTSDQRGTLDSLLAGFSATQKSWLSGFLAAVGPINPEVPAATGNAAKLTVLYGTESGNSETLADRAVKEAKKRGFAANMRNMAEISPADLAKIPNLLVIVSTWGDGEPPETAAPFYKELMETGADFSATRFSVCALGDTAYEKFCQTGKDIDARLEALGAIRVTERQDCDVDYEDAFNAWLGRALEILAPSAADPVVTTPAAPVSTVEYGKKHPFPAEVLEVVHLNGRRSAKETLHLEFSLAGSGMSYEPGDALAVVPVNAPDVVQSVLEAAKLGGSEEVEVKAIGTKPLAEALREDFDITALSRNVLVKLSQVTGSPRLKELLADEAKEGLKNYVDGREIIDALHDFAPSGLSAAALAGIFRKLPPRLYSIASSPLAHPDQVHLTVAAVRYQTHGRSRKGVCSTYLADLVKPGDHAEVFVQPNKNFRLPADGAVPVIMVGPGTGIAPFRAFVEHRAALGSPGKNWLFMGDQHYLYDFLYQLEWQDHLKSGALTRLDVAFSRDQPEKIYVQHRLRERARDLYAWLEEGAHFYVCGDASRMAADVHESLISIIQDQAGKSREAAQAYVEDLRKTKRYQRDVY